MEKRMEKTDYKITEFHNSEFGSIRMIEDGGRLLFSGMDVAFALGYAKPRNAINVHCKGALKRGVLIILQSQSQLKAMYKDSADTILGNCDTTLFLGGKEKTTLKEMSELLGKETIDLYNTSETRSNQKSFGLNYQKTGKQLMTEDEIAVMYGGKCILQIRGARPFFSDKYDITKHKNYRLLADENEKNRYKVEKELNPQYTPKSEEEVEVIHVELSE